MENLATCKSCSAPIGTDKHLIANGLCKSCQSSIKDAPGAGGDPGLGILEEGSSSRWLITLAFGIVLIIPIFLLSERAKDQGIKNPKPGAGFPSSVHPNQGLGSALPGADARVKLGPVGYESAVSIKKMVQSMQIETAKRNSEYTAEMTKVGFFDFPDGLELSEAKDYRKTFANLARCREIAQRYKNMELEMFTSIYDRIENMKLTQPEKEALLEGMKNSEKSAMELSSEIWEQEFRRIELMEEIANLLEDETGNWEVDEEGAISMREEDKSKRLEELQKAADECFIRQSDIKKKYLDDLAESRKQRSVKVQ